MSYRSAEYLQKETIGIQDGSFILSPIIEHGVIYQTSKQIHQPNQKKEAERKG